MGNPNSDVECGRCGESVLEMKNDPRWGETCADCHEELNEENGKVQTVACNHCGAENMAGSNQCRDCKQHPTAENVRGDGQPMTHC